MHCNVEGGMDENRYQVLLLRLYNVISLTFISGRSNLLLLLYWIKLKTDTAEYFILSLDGGTF